MAENLRRVTARIAPNVTKNPDDEILDRICQMAQEGATPEAIRKVATELLPDVEPINAGIIRTRQGALMVRVSDDRWPIAMYKKDWRILLSKIPAIEKALDTLNILDENPNPTKGKALAQEAEVKTG